MNSATLLLNDGDLKKIAEDYMNPISVSNKEQIIQSIPKASFSKFVGFIREIQVGQVLDVVLPWNDWIQSLQYCTNDSGMCHEISKIGEAIQNFKNSPFTVMENNIRELQTCVENIRENSTNINI